MNDDVRTGAAVGFGAYLLWGLLTIYWKELHRFDPFELIGYRVAGSGVLLVILLAVKGRLRAMLAAFRRPEIAWRVALAAVLLTGNWTSYVWAVTHDNVVETALGYFLAPLGTMLLGVVVLKERMHTVQRRRRAHPRRRRRPDRRLRPRPRAGVDHRRVMDLLRPVQAADPARLDGEPDRRAGSAACTTRRTSTTRR